MNDLWELVYGDPRFDRKVAVDPLQVTAVAAHWQHKDMCDLYVAGQVYLISRPYDDLVQEWKDKRDAARRLTTRGTHE